jgi:PilZ domain-containing protein
MSASFEWEQFDVRSSPLRSGRALLEIPVELQGGGASCAGVTRNLSQQGAFVAVRRPPSVGERVTLRLAVPGLTVPLAVDAEVRWLRPIADTAGQPAGIGVSFIDPPYGVSLCIAWLLHTHKRD